MVFHEYPWLKSLHLGGKTPKASKAIEQLWLRTNCSALSQKHIKSWRQSRCFFEICTLLHAIFLQTTKKNNLLCTHIYIRFVMKVGQRQRKTGIWRSLNCYPLVDQQEKNAQQFWYVVLGNCCLSGAKRSCCWRSRSWYAVYSRICQFRFVFQHRTAM